MQMPSLRLDSCWGLAVHLSHTPSHTPPGEPPARLCHEITVPDARSLNRIGALMSWNRFTVAQWSKKQTGRPCAAVFLNPSLGALCGGQMTTLGTALTPVSGHVMRVCVHTQTQTHTDADHSDRTHRVPQPQILGEVGSREQFDTDI